MNYLLTSIKTRDKDRPACFVCLGLVCVAVGPLIGNQIPDIFNVCKSCLPNKVRSPELIGKI